MAYNPARSPRFNKSQSSQNHSPGPGTMHHDPPQVQTQQFYNGPATPTTEKLSPLGASRGLRDSDVHNRLHRGQSKFDTIRTECLRRGVMYEDPDFPASDTSLYFSRNPPQRFEWKRPAEIANRFRGAKPAFFADGATRFDVKQGKLGDCWVLASIACLTSPDHRELFRRVVPADQGFQDGSYAGIFRFNFWYFGEWKEVIVDDRLPTYRGDLVFVHSNQPNEFWASLLEKAYAKLYGSYEALKGGNVGDSLTDFTGGITEIYVLRGPNADVPPHIVNILFKALDRQSLIGCGINNVEGRTGTETRLQSGLVAGHAYSITDLREILLMSDRGQIPITLVRVRNPWGTHVEWNGAWGDRSPEWNSIPEYERERMGLVFRDDGEFWMDFRDFLEHFDSIDICNLTPDSPIDMPRQWHTAEYHGRWQKGFSAGGRPTQRETHWTNPQFHVSLTDTDEDDDKVCSFILQLMQKDRRKIKQKAEKLAYIGYMVYKLAKGFTLPLKKEFFDHNDVVASCDVFINSRQISKRMTLPPGDYVVVPSTHAPHQNADFYLRIFFENRNSTESADELPEKVDIPAPQPSPEHDKEDFFKRFFYSVSGEDMEVNPYELQTGINEALRKEPLHRDISIDACKTFINLLDVDNTGKLGYTEFQYLWSMLRSWKKVFYMYDTDKSGKMNSYELRKALGAAGYKVNNSTVSAMVFRYANQNDEVELDNFLICLGKLTKLFNVYKNFRQNGHASFTLDQWLEQSLLI